MLTKEMNELESHIFYPHVINSPIMSTRILVVW